MIAERLTYLDSSAIVKLAQVAPETAALRRYLLRRRPYISSALARTEVMRALSPGGPDAVRRGDEILLNIDLVRVNDRVLRVAGELRPPTVRTIDAIHLATARMLGGGLARLVTYDQRMMDAARSLGVTVASPA